jgi:hypothetical protein
MTTAEQRRMTAKGVERKRELADLRFQVRTGLLPLEVVMRDQPESLANIMVIDLLRWMKRSHHSRLTVIGERALAADVNLMKRLGAMSTREREWVAEHGLHGMGAGHTAAARRRRAVR